MEERKTIFAYVGQVLAIFGFAVIMLNLFCIWFGEDAQGYSTMFSLGKEGLSVETMMQFLLVSIGTVAIRFLLYTDIWIKNMGIALRTVCMIILEIVMIAVFVLVCGWFPVDMWQPWAMFFICFAFCFTVSVSVMMLRERMENKKMEAALMRLKKKEEGE